MTINNNFSGHGFYQFSPEVFIQVFQKEYGMELLELFLAEVDSEPSTWINVKTSEYYRQSSTFNSTKSVYILTIARKLFDSNTTVLNKTPQQNSYKIDWGFSIALASAGLVTVIPLLLFNAATTRLPLTITGLLQYITPSIMFLIGIVVFHEPLQLTKLIGFIFIWIALVILGRDPSNVS